MVLRNNFYRPSRSHPYTLGEASRLTLPGDRGQSGTVRAAHYEASRDGLPTRSLHSEAHRSVNTSNAPLFFLWTRSLAAGHDQAVMERNGASRVEGRPPA